MVLASSSSWNSTAGGSGGSHAAAGSAQPRGRGGWRRARCGHRLGTIESISSSYRQAHKLRRSLRCQPPARPPPSAHAAALDILSIHSPTFQASGSLVRSVPSKKSLPDAPLGADSSRHPDPRSLAPPPPPPLWLVASEELAPAARLLCVSLSAWGCSLSRGVLLPLRRPLDLSACEPEASQAARGTSLRRCSALASGRGLMAAAAAAEKQNARRGDKRNCIAP